MALRHLLPAKVRMNLKERSRYISVDPDTPAEAKTGDNIMEMQFENALDMYEFELNNAADEEGELTDGFYSSEEQSNKESHS